MQVDSLGGSRTAPFAVVGVQAPDCQKWQAEILQTVKQPVQGRLIANPAGQRRGAVGVPGDLEVVQPLRPGGVELAAHTNLVARAGRLRRMVLGHASSVRPSDCSSVTRRDYSEGYVLDQAEFAGAEQRLRA